MPDVRSSPPQIFSRARRIASRTRMAAAQARSSAASYVMQDMVEDALDRIAFMQLRPGKVLVIGDYSAQLVRALEDDGWTVTSSDPVLGDNLLDQEAPYPLEPQDLIVSLGTLDTVNDLPGALIHLHRALAEDGLLMAQIVGAGSLHNLREAMLAADGNKVFARMHPLVDNRAATGLLERAGFKRQVVDTRTLAVRYSSLSSLVEDLRAQGLGSALADRAPPLSRAQLAAANERFAIAADADGKTLERFEILTLTGWR